MESKFVATGKKQKDVIVCDSSGTMTVTLWEKNIDILEEQASYCLQNFVARWVRLQQVLGDGDARITSHGNIGEVQQAEAASGYSEILNAAIIGVSPLTNCVTTNAFGFLNIYRRRALWT